MISNSVLTLCVCVIFDKVAGVYSAPMSFQNEECAKRYIFDSFSNKLSASDYELYKVAEFNIENGKFITLDDKSFICRGEYNGGKE